MKYVLVLYYIVNGAPVEHGRVNEDPMTQQQCQSVAMMVGAAIISRQPELAGKIKLDCQPQSKPQ